MAPTIRTVANYNTHEVHSIDFFGNNLLVTVTPTASVIRQWISNVQLPNYDRPLVVGVGVQWTPFVESYNSDDSDSDSYSPPPQQQHRHYVDSPADTLQLCVGKRCLIIQLSHCNRVPDELRSFLMDPDTIFVGLRNSQDARKLARSRHQLEIGELLDLRNYVRDSQGYDMRRCSFEEIVEECMGFRGVRLDPEISMSDWSDYDLGYDQILQASLDVYVCFHLGVWYRIWEE